ncbi:Unknown protein sequence [Pseudomonas amygdali pv. lachrymans]|nr:Unknown protein sequence [Pseudomonas amygdali pv. lachrymans]
MEDQHSSLCQGSINLGFSEHGGLRIIANLKQPSAGSPEHCQSFKRIVCSS